MCFGGSPKYEPPATPAAPAVEPAPKIDPLPTPMSPEPTTVAAADKRKKLAAIRAGYMSTVKTSPRGVAGTGIDLMPNLGSGDKKVTLGS